jgi:hypothetical protein
MVIKLKCGQFNNDETIKTFSNLNITFSDRIIKMLIVLLLKLVIHLFWYGRELSVQRGKSIFEHMLRNNCAVTGTVSSSYISDNIAHIQAPNLYFCHKIWTLMQTNIIEWSKSNIPCCAQHLHDTRAMTHISLRNTSKGFSGSFHQHIYRTPKFFLQNP